MPDRNCSHCGEFGIELCGYICIGRRRQYDSDAGSVHGDQYGFVFFDGNSVFYVGRKLDGVWRNRKKAG